MQLTSRAHVRLPTKPTAGLPYGKKLVSLCLWMTRPASLGMRALPVQLLVGVSCVTFTVLHGPGYF